MACGARTAAWRVDHVIRHLRERVDQPATKSPVGHLLGQRLRHAQHPLIALDGADGIGVVVHAQAWMAFSGDVERWHTESA